MSLWNLRLTVYLVRDLAIYTCMCVCLLKGLSIFQNLHRKRRQSRALTGAIEKQNFDLLSIWYRRNTCEYAIWTEVWWVPDGEARVLVLASPLGTARFRCCMQSNVFHCCQNVLCCVCCTRTQSVICFDVVIHFNTTAAVSKTSFHIWSYRFYAEVTANDITGTQTRTSVCTHM